MTKYKKQINIKYQKRKMHYLEKNEPDNKAGILECKQNIERLRNYGK